MIKRRNQHRSTRTSKAEQEILPPVGEPTDEDVEKQTAALVHYTAMCWEIQHCARVDEAKDIRDKAMALAVYAKQAQNHEAEKLLAEIRLRAEARAGLLLKQTDKNQGAKGIGKKVQSDSSTALPKLADLGISKDQSSQWQQLANIPESEREAYIAEPDQIPSASGLLAKHAAAKTIEAEAVVVTGEPERAASARKKVLLNRNNLRLADFCEENRYTLDAMLVTRDETVVTNGHYLVRVTLPKINASYPDVPGWPADSGEWTEALVPRATAIEALKNVRRKQAHPILENAVIFKGADGHVRVGTTDLDQHEMVVSRPVEGRFPNWKAVLPKRPQFTITLDADYLARLAKNAAEFMADRGGETKPLRLQFTAADGRVRMDCQPNHDGQQWTAILMPVRCTAYRNDYEADPVAVPNPFADVPECVECVDETADETRDFTLAVARPTVPPAEQEKTWSSLYPKIELTESEARRHETRADEIAASEPLEVLFAIVAQLGFCDPLGSDEYRSWARDWIEAQGPDVDEKADEETSAANKRPCSPADADALDGGGKRRGDAAS